MKSIYRIVGLILVYFFIAGISGCVFEPSSKTIAERAANRNSENRDYYIMKNDVEYKNYAKRQELADDPTAIIWCTSAFPIPDSPIFTVPVVAKLTSGGKTPFVKNIHQEGPDAMHGSSGEYRYGFTPADMYVDYYNMSVFCTNMPTVWQRQSTTIVMQTDPQLSAANEAAMAKLKSGLTGKNKIDPKALKEAYDILEKAIAESK